MQYFCHFVFHVFVVADKSNVICILLTNYIVSYVVFVRFCGVIVRCKIKSEYKVLNGCNEHVMYIVIIVVM